MKLTPRVIDKAINLNFIVGKFDANYKNITNKQRYPEPIYPKNAVEKSWLFIAKSAKKVFDFIGKVLVTKSKNAPI